MNTIYKEKIDSLSVSAHEWNNKKLKYREKAKMAEEQEKKCLAEIESLEKEIIIQEHREMDNLVQSLGGTDTGALKKIIENHPEIQNLISEFIKAKDADANETVVLETTESIEI